MRLIRLVIFISFLFHCCVVYPLPAEDVEIINNTDYFPKVHGLLQNANKSIFLIMFSAHYYDKFKNSPSNLLLMDLVSAKKRGVDVKVILEQENPPEQHGRAAAFLKKNKIPYILDPPDVTTHAKLIIVDGEYTVIGSTNWSYSALSKNNETAVIIKSKEVSRAYIGYFRELEKNYIKI